MKELAIDYKDITKHLLNMEEYLRVSFDMEENHLQVMKMVHGFMSDIKNNVEILKNDGQMQKLDQLVERLVGFFSNLRV